LHQRARAAKLLTHLSARISQVELIVFDLDGMLLNQESAISGYTSETLKLLAQAFQHQKFSYTNEHKTPMSIQKDMIKT
jgi:hypothetical protein